MAKDKRDEYFAKYWAEHKKEISTKRKKKYSQEREKILARNKQWFKNNKDKWNAYQREYRRRKKAELDKSNKA